MGSAGGPLGPGWTCPLCGCAPLPGSARTWARRADPACPSGGCGGDSGSSALPCGPGGASHGPWCLDAAWGSLSALCLRPAACLGFLGRAESPGPSGVDTEQVSRPRRLETLAGRSLSSGTAMLRVLGTGPAGGAFVLGSWAGGHTAMGAGRGRATAQGLELDSPDGRGLWVMGEGRGAPGPCPGAEAPCGQQGALSHPRPPACTQCSDLGPGCTRGGPRSLTGLGQRALWAPCSGHSKPCMTSGP